MLRLAAKMIAVVVLVAFLLIVATSLQARQAIANDALDNPIRCINARDLDAFRAGNLTQMRMDGLIAEQVRDYYLHGEHARAGEWHLRGMWAYLGFRFGYTTNQRRALAMRTIGQMKRCP